MRLIDADTLNEEVMNFSMAITGNPKQAMIVKGCKASFKRMIDEQPTVFDIDKIKGQMERVREEVLSDITFNNEIINHYLGYIDLLIEVVEPEKEG